MRAEDELSSSFISKIGVLDQSRFRGKDLWLKGSRRERRGREVRSNPYSKVCLWCGWA